MIGWAPTKEGVAMLGLPVHSGLVGQIGSTLFSEMAAPSLRHAPFLTHRSQGGEFAVLTG